MRRIKVRASEILEAARTERERFPGEPNAGAMGVLLHPQVYRRWRAANKEYPGLKIERVRGIPPHQVKDGRWARCAGYILRFSEGRFGTWNCVRGGGYGHSPRATWDGVRRETRHSFVDALYSAAVALAAGTRPTWATERILRRYRITLIDDIGEGGTYGVVGL
ncbi:MAG TPA: hypothetical protein EYP14_16445 [Planctomycetaceae bacterium]|nr:hypothetical protein [Planctomycetaceae bacterium]